MKAVHIQVVGDSRGQGALALCFGSAAEMGEVGAALVRMAAAGNCNLCLNSQGTTPEQGAVNVEVAAFEARCIPAYEVSRIEAPRASMRSVIPVQGRRLPAYAQAVEPPPLIVVSGNGANGRPQAQMVAESGDVKASLGVEQPWTKQGIPEPVWRRQHRWPAKEA